MKKTHFWVLSILLTVLLGCSPQYRTTYLYEVPSTERGRLCVINCQKMKQKCFHWSENSYQQCLNRDVLVNLSTQRSSVETFAPHDAHTSYRCEGRKSSQDENCLSDYNACYELCGGFVEAIQECVMNCG